MSFFKNLLRWNLLTRIGLSLILLGSIPVAVAVLPTFSLQREALLDKTLRIHSVAASAVSHQVAARFDRSQGLADELAANPLLHAGPLEADTQQLLKATLAARPSIAAVRLSNALGEEIIRAQRPSLKAGAEWALAQEGPSPLQLLEFDQVFWIRADSIVEDSGARLTLVEKAEGFADLLTPTDLGEEAAIALLDFSGQVMAGNPEIHRFLPQQILDLGQANTGGSQRFTDTEGRDWLGGFDRVTASPYFVASIQPSEVAERVSLQLKKDLSLALATGLLLASLLLGASYFSIIKPVKSILLAQRRLGATSTKSNEIAALKESLEILADRLRDREDLGSIFLGRYEVLSLIGSGAMGTVFRGWDPRLKRSLALKTIRLGVHEPSSSTSVKSLLDEAIKAARFNHPHIVSIYDAAGDEEAAFVAMELVEGIDSDLYAFRSGGRISPRLGTLIGLATADALETAHEEGLLHRDIKPANILLGKDNSIKVSDFGIAEFLSLIGRGEGKVFGTPGYLAPEAIQGEPPEPANDLFSLGVTLYQLLSGTHPFRQKQVTDTLITTVQKEAPPLSEVLDWVPAELDRIIQGLMKKDPKNRPSLKEVQDSFRELIVRTGWASEIPLPDKDRKPTDGIKMPAMWLPTQAAPRL